MSKKIFTLIAIGASLNALAQKDTSRATNLDEVVITATKFPIKTSATGKVVTIITKEQLEQSGGKDLAQILTEQTGLYINGANSNTGKDKSIFLRGATGAYTLITIDGVPMYDPTGIGSNFDIRNISIDLIERIEILKGSQSTLYGSDAIAGVINIITKKSSNTTTKPFAGNALLSYGSYNTIKATAGINGKVKTIDYYAGYSLNKTDGINEAASTTANADKDGYKQEAFQVGLGIQATKNIAIKPFLRYSWVKGDADNGGFINDNDYTYNQKVLSVGIKNELNFNKVKLNVVYSFNKTDRNILDDSLSQDPNLYNYYTKASFNAKEHIVDAYSNFSLNKSLKLTVGADYRTSKTSTNSTTVNFDYFTNSPSVNNSVQSGDSVKQHQVGVYAALTYNNDKGFNIELGGRYNNHSTYGGNGVFNINPSYQINKDIKIFANVSSAYKTPSLYQLYSEYGNKNLKPEVALTTELGLQNYFANRKIKTQIVAFSRNVSDVLYFQSTFLPPYGFYINQDKQKDLGVEFDASFKLSKTTTLKTAYTFVDGKIDTKKSSGKDTTYNNLLRRPKHTVNIGLSSQITKRFFASANLNWFGKRNDTYFDYNTFKTAYVELSSYALLDIYAEYGFLKNKLKVFVNGRNITDTKYTEISGYNTLGATVTGGVRFNF